MPNFLSELPIASQKPHRVYRLDGHLQAGTSLLCCEQQIRRSDICNAFFNPSYVISGNGWYIDTDGRRFRYGPGMLFIRFAGVRHHQEHEAGSFYLDKYLSLPPQFGEVLIARGLMSPERPVLDLGEHRRIAERFDELAALLERAKEDELVLVMADFFAFIGKLLLSESVQRPHYAQIMAAAEALALDFSGRLTLRDAAGVARLSPSNFRRLFGLYLQTTPAEYRRRKRIERIRVLLTTTTLSLKEVAAATGYPDIYTFAHQFKRCVGCTPGVYRKSTGLCID